VKVPSLKVPCFFTSLSIISQNQTFIKLMLQCFAHSSDSKVGNVSISFLGQMALVSAFIRKSIEGNKFI
jgi:hypothetical protein